MRKAQLGALAGVVAVCLQTSVALACGTSAPPFYVVKEQSPTGSATPLNAPLVVSLAESADGPVVDSFNPTLTLTTDDSDIAVSLKALGGAPNPAWVPVEPLEPETRYEAHFNPGYEGVPDTVWSFTTNTESTPRLALEGNLEVTLESGAELITVSPCAPGCGNEGDCAAAGHNELVNLTKARVKLPRAVNGFAHRSAQIWLTDEKPYDFFEPSKTGPEPYRGTNVSKLTSADLDDPSVTEVLVTLPEEGAPYRPCFSFIATDARGDQAVAQLCLDTLFPMATTSDEPSVSDGDAGHAGLDNEVEQPSSRTSKGCSVGTGGAGGSAWLVALGLLASTRKRGWRSATRGALSAARRR